MASFIAAKRIEGCSEKTLKYYQTTIDAMVSSLGKNVRHILTEVQIFLQMQLCAGIEVHDPFLIAFAEHHALTLRKIDVSGFWGISG